ncbi:hypothetical protein D3C77_596520 [compost metagenome]
MILGKPVVAYSSGGLTEIFKLTGNQSYLARSGDYFELSAKTSAFLEQPGLAESAGNNNRVRIEACFGPGAYEANLQAVVEKINSLPAGNVPALVAPALPPATTKPKRKKRRRLRRGSRLSSARRAIRARRKDKAGGKKRTKRGNRNLRRTKQNRSSRRRKKRKK